MKKFDNEDLKLVMATEECMPTNRNMNSTTNQLHKHKSFQFKS
jgi:hypothetical protein